MKRLLCCTLAAAMLLFANGCSGGGTTNSDLSQKLDTEEAIVNYITDRIPDGCIYIMADVDKPITVLITNEKASVTIKASSDFCIPTLADEFIPIVKEALEENDTALGKISFSYYRTNASGIVRGSMVDWTTSDGEKGTFSHEEDGVLKTNYTVADLHEYYKDFDELVEKLRSGE